MSDTLIKSREPDQMHTDYDRLPFTQGVVYYCQAIQGRALQDVVNPENTNIPLEPHTVKIMDARAIRDELDIDQQGFMLIDHKSEVSHLRDTKTLEEPYNKELVSVVADISGADFVLPHLNLFVRFAAKAGTPEGKETNLPSGYVHMDFSRTSFLENVDFVLDRAGLPRKKYRRVAMYQTWRAVSEPPQDFPFTFTDARSPKPGKTVVLDNIIGPTDVPGNIVETLLGLPSDSDQWFYFSNMREDELLVFKGYDTDYNDTQNVLHTAFDDRGAQKNAKPRESIEARFIAFWE